MCNDGGGWTVFQRRMDGTVDFYQTWADYLKGFGDLKGEFWLGLNKIHRLTDILAQNSSTLRVDMEDFSGIKRYAKYNLFYLNSADSKYSIIVSGYTGNAGDSLSQHNGKKFTTRDQDNDDSSTNCAVASQGAWWYASCHHSNLNGLYLVGEQTSAGNGVNWDIWRGINYSLKVTEMKTRRNY